MTPLPRMLEAITDPAARQNQGALELYVKTNHRAIMADIEGGGGAALTRSFDLANVPATDRPARILALQGDFAAYESNPGSLILSLGLWGR